MTCEADCGKVNPNGFPHRPGKSCFHRTMDGPCYCSWQCYKRAKRMTYVRKLADEYLCDNGMDDGTGELYSQEAGNLELVIAEAIAHTIERCAREALAVSQSGDDPWHLVSEAIAARIRNLPPEEVPDTNAKETP